MWKGLFLVLLSLLAASAEAVGTSLSSRIDAVATKTYPRLAAVSYAGQLDDPIMQKRLAKWDLLILGTSSPLVLETAKIKTLNPNVLIGLYTVLGEARKHKGSPLVIERENKIDQQGWWLKSANGEPMQWTTQHNAWDVNISDWSKPDRLGEHYPEWAARFWNKWLFKPNPKIDIWFFDNVFYQSRVKRADWKGIGTDQSNTDPDIVTAFRAAHVKEVNLAKKLSPQRLMVANADNDLSYPGYKGLFHGAQLECFIGNYWSMKTLYGWEAMMQRYKNIYENLSTPKLMLFGACIPDYTDYKLFRFAFTSSLLGDSYFHVSDGNHNTFPWFDEFNVSLGYPETAPFPNPELNGVYIRKFTKGMIVVNPTNKKAKVTIDGQYRKINGVQDSAVNDGLPVSSVEIPSEDGLVLLKD